LSDSGQEPILEVQVLGVTTLPVVGQTYTLIEIDPAISRITGDFMSPSGSDLVEGATFFDDEGFQWQISYAGGTNHNAVVLTCLSLGQVPVDFPALALFDDLGNFVSIDSTGTVTCDGSCSTTSGPSLSPGRILWSGAIGVFTVNTVAGESKPFLPFPWTDLDFLVSTGNTGGTLTIEWTDVGFNGTGPTTMDVADSLAGSVSATHIGYIDSTNTPFGTGTLVGSLGPFTSSTKGNLIGPGPTAEPFSMTSVVIAVMGPSSAFSLVDIDLRASPGP
jgi:hypothetical protein